MMEAYHQTMLRKQREATESRRKSTQRAIYALVSLRAQYSSDMASRDILKAWVTEDERLRIQIHNYDEFLAL